MERIAVVGCGYVGGVSAACFAELGYQVDCIDVDTDRIAAYRTGRSPIYEPGLDVLLERGLGSGRLRFHETYPVPFEPTIAFIAVNTPGSQEGAADLRAVRDAVAAVAPLLKPGSIIVNKSTVPIGTGDLVLGIARRAAGHDDIAVVSNPEFLREGTAISDFLHPDRIVIGASDDRAGARVASLYESLNAPVVSVDLNTAEMIKYASNAFLATKISFINEIASICEALGADVRDVAAGMGLDERIGGRFLEAGLGWGGSCFPKDVRALAHMAGVHGTHPQLLKSVIEINAAQRLRTVSRLRDSVQGFEGRRIVVLGAAFKANTDDIRNSPPLELAALLAMEGAEVLIADPAVPPSRIEAAVPGARAVADLGNAVRGASALILATDWAEYLELDYATLARTMARPVIFDARNALEPTRMREAGFDYLCIGRPAREGGRVNGIPAGAAAGGAS